MSWRHTLITSTTTALVATGMLVGFQVLVDPMGIWSPSIAGFNQAKVQARGVERVIKPYQHASIRPDVVIFGSSRAGYGLPAEWEGYADERVFNYGLNASRLEEVLDAVRHVVAVHPPKVVVLGLDPSQFSPRLNDAHIGWGADPERDAAIEQGLGGVYRLRDTVFSIDAITASYETIQASRERPNLVFFERGYRPDKGGRHMLSQPGWRERMHVYTWTYAGMNPLPASADALGRTVDELRARGIEVHVVLLPDHADLMTVWRAHPHQWQRLTRLKQQIASHTDFWDFYQVEGWSKNNRNFRDAAHINDRFGYAILKRIQGEEGPGARVTADNLDEAIARQASTADRWLAERPGLRELVTEKGLKRPAFEARLRTITPWLK